jgi:hypothetical protein
MSVHDTDKPVDVDAVSELASGPGPFPWTFARDIRLMCAELKKFRAESETGQVAVLRIREHAAKKENETLKKLLTTALEIADTLLLHGHEGATSSNLDAMDKLHVVRAAAKKLGVE